MKKLPLLLGLASLAGLILLSGAVLLAIKVESDAKAQTPPPAELVGTWSTSRVSTINYRDRLTGSYRPPSGHTFSYKIAADGAYELSGLLQSSMYGCTMSVFKWERGVLAAEGKRVTFTPREGKVHSNDTCRRGAEKERVVVDAPSTYTWHVETDDARSVLVMKTADGKDWGRFYRR